jgi:hypothetical protein
MPPLSEPLGRLGFTPARALAKLSAGAALLGSTSVFAGMAGLGWDSNPEPDIAGYIVSYSDPNGTQLTNSVDVGLRTSAMITGLQDGADYRFHVKAYNTAGLVSKPSQTLFGTVDKAGGFTYGSKRNDVILVSNGSATAAVYTVSGDDFVVAYPNMLEVMLSGQGGRDTIIGSPNPDGMSSLNGGQHNDFIRLEGGENSATGGNNVDTFSVGWRALVHGRRQVITDFNLTDRDDGRGPGSSHPAQLGDILVVGAVSGFDPDSDRVNDFILFANGDRGDLVVRVRPDGEEPNEGLPLVVLRRFGDRHPGMVDPRTGKRVTPRSWLDLGNLVLEPENPPDGTDEPG